MNVLEGSLFALAAVFAGLFAWELVRAIKKPELGVRLLGIIRALMTLCIAAVALVSVGFVPVWLRDHLADILLPFLAAQLLWKVVRSQLITKKSKTSWEESELVKLLWVRVGCTPLALVLLVGWEVLEGVLNKRWGWLGFSGFDGIDVLCYVGGTLMVLALLLLPLWRYRGHHNDHSRGRDLGSVVLYM